MKRTSRAKTPKALFRLVDGPWEGHSLALSGDSGSCTAWLQVGGEVGRYARGNWQRAEG